MLSESLLLNMRVCIYIYINFFFFIHVYEHPNLQYVQNAVRYRVGPYRFWAFLAFSGGVSAGLAPISSRSFKQVSGSSRLIVQGTRSPRMNSTQQTTRTNMNILLFKWSLGPPWMLWSSGCSTNPASPMGDKTTCARHNSAESPGQHMVITKEPHPLNRGKEIEKQDLVDFTSVCYMRRSLRV